MSVHRLTKVTRIAVVLFGVVGSTTARAQAGAKPKDAAAAKTAKAAKDSAKLVKAAKDSARIARFFEPVDPLPLTLTTDLKRIRGDKGTTPPWRSATLTYAGAPPDTAPVRIRLRIKTRGIWRLKTCEFPPIFLNFTSEAVKGTPLRGLDQVKLTSYCRNNDEFERYVLQEFQLYRILHLLTPASHAVRLVRMAYVDSASGKKDATRYAFVEEEAVSVAARMGGRMIKIKGATPDDLDPFQDALVGVFQYMIGNTDFGISVLHNAELLALDNGVYLPVVYDFDFSGAVNARYATVDPQLTSIHSVRERLYRGYCVPAEIYPKVFALFNAKKDAIYALYRDPVGALLPPDIVKKTLEYYDDFYKTINTPRDAKAEIIDRCLGGKR